MLLKQSLRLAWRDLRGGLGGLRLLAICLFLGVGAIAGVGSLSSAIVAELSAQGRVILGGDIEVTLSQRQATAAERAILARLGRVSESAKLRAMAIRADGADSTLVDLKAVDGAYPLYGTFAAAPGAIATKPAPGLIFLAPATADRLRLHVGDPLRIGAARLTVAGAIADEPDHVGEGFGFGPTAIVDMATLARTALVRPGSLYSWRYRVALPSGANAGRIAARFTRDHADAGWKVQDSSDGAPNTRRFITQIGQFLALVGLTALVIAGIGVGNGVSAYLDAKRSGIATLKTLGASSALIFRVYLIEVGVVAIGAVILALAAGMFVPTLVALLAGSALPVSPRPGLYPLPMALAASYGLLVAFAFALAPLARAKAVSAASLFRGAVEDRHRPPPAVLIAVAAAILLAAGLAIGTANEPLFAAGFLGAAAVLLALLSAFGWVLRRLAARLPRPRRPLLRLVLANLHAPAAQTDRLVVALGLGLTLFATLAVIQTSLSGQLRDSVPARAPTFVMLDIPSADADRFRALIDAAAPGAPLVTVPSLRGPIVAIKSVRVVDMKGPAAGSWYLRGDRSLTFARDVPSGNVITDGKWWAPDYAGPPLVSMDADMGTLLDLKVGDPITVSALGVEVPATIASFRRIDWQSLGFNFVLVFSPHTFDGAPFNYMATLAVPASRERAVSAAVAHAFPSVSVLQVKDIIDAVGGLLGQLATAVAAAGSVAIAAGIAVLIGALAAARRAKTYDAVLLKLLGATRAQVLLVQALEIGLLAAAVGVIALGLGAGAGWYVVTRVLELPFAPDWAIVIATLAGGVALIVAIGLAGAWPALAARPARALRDL